MAEMIMLIATSVGVLAAALLGYILGRRAGTLAVQRQIMRGRILPGS